MLSGTLALFERSLRQETRGTRGHLLRLGFVGFIYLALLFAVASSLAVGAPGLRFFGNICYLNVLFIVLAGVSLFATAVTEEKEEGTLGLLRMANVGRAALMLGKSTSRLVAAAFLLLGQVPFVLLAITLGGVLVGQIAAAFGALLAFLYLAANVGLLWSVRAKRSATAATLTGVSLAAYLGLPPLARFVAGLVGDLHPPWAAAADRFAGRGDDWALLSRLDEIMATGFAGSVWCPQVAFCLVAGSSAFAAAYLLFDKHAVDDRASVPDRGPLPLLGRRGPADKPAHSTAGRAWRDAVAWKEFHFLAWGWPGVLLRVVVLAAGTAAFAYYGQFARHPLGTAGLSGMLAAAVLYAADTLFQAARVLSDERKWNTLDNLMLLPIPTRRMLLGKLKGLLYSHVVHWVWFFGSATLALVFVHDGPRGDEFLTQALPSIFAAVLVWWLFLEVVAYLSTVVRWGSVPLAVLVFLVGSYALSPVLLVAAAFGGISGEPGLTAVPIAVVAGFLLAGGAVAIARRLETLAGS